MREILFRAKHYKTKQWVYGIPFRNPVNGLDNDAYYPQIIPEINKMHSTIDRCSVIEETISQYTGLTDKNGVKIFEGDIIKQYEKTQFGDPVSDFGLVKWDNKECMLFRTSTRIGKDRLVTSHDIYEVVGNIHDNPELLEVSDDNG